MDKQHEAIMKALDGVNPTEAIFFIGHTLTKKERSQMGVVKHLMRLLFMLSKHLTQAERGIIANSYRDQADELERRIAPTCEFKQQQFKFRR